MYLSKSEAATVLGVSYRYITKLIANGTLKVELNVLGKERILQKDVRELKKVREVHIDFDRTKYINSAELADRLGVSRAAVSVTYKQKISHIVVGREVLFAASAVDQYIEDSKLREEQTRGYLTVVEAAKIIGISMPTAHKWCDTGRLSYVEGKHGQKFVSPEEVERARKQFIEEAELTKKLTEGAISR